MPGFKIRGVKGEHAGGGEHEQSGCVADSTQGPLDLVDQGVVLLDNKGQITDINTEALRLLKCERAALPGRDFWDAVTEDIAEEHQASTASAMVLSDRHAFVAHHEFEGSWLEFSFRRHPAGLVVNLRDVSPLQLLQRQFERSERHKQLVFDTNPSAMWVFDTLSQRIVAANAAAVAFYGLAQSAFLKLPMGTLFPDGEGASLLSALDAFKGPGDVQLTPQICKQRKASGQLVLVELAYGRLDWDGRKAVLVTIADVTERHLADRALRRENADLERRGDLLRDELEATRADLAAFTYALSHDLQAPLHAANGFATRLADKHTSALDETGRHYVERIQASTRQLARLVDDLRALVQLPQLSAELEQLDLAGLAAPLIDDLRKRHPERLVAVEMTPGQSLMGDRVLLTTALACLLDNAWKFTSRKSEGWIKLGLLPGNEDEAILQLSDNGTGFDGAYAGKLFIAFQRLHSSADFPGNGLGLALVKKVAERHKGRVWAESGATGASFFLALPQGRPAPG